ncbi:uncharacterized protein LOC119070877 [Bradysia coprophila]|uniref:uncharacterized protein LOC119070877 n=1 Tax=Bradysia coprophila TaxID=38358 RepID=UPI00187DA2C7|nr:uncharacterized protein LOC119070877 [Bradysia coprophila]XP_037031289.1 uncharacterized protein LOC119070877 [Bradysia coprophila]
MSTTHHEMSASGSIVVVDNSGNVNISKSNAPQSQQQFQRQLQNQQVIVNDEYMNADGLMAGGVNYITTNDLMNNAQIIKFVTGEEAALIEQQQYHHQDDQLYGAMSAQQSVQGISNPNSKVHVISNVTIVSKPQHQSPHTISFVNSRHLPAGGNYVNTYISKQNCGKLVPYHQSPPHQNHHQQQILTKHGQASGQVAQKGSMPRIVTRVQTISTQQQSSNNIVMSRNTNVAPITSVIQSHQVQKHQHSMQLVPMNKANSLRNKPPNAVSSSVKVMHGTKAGGMKAIPQQQQQQQHLSKGKNSKLVKSYGSAPSSSIYDQQQQHQIKNIHVQSNSINNNNNTINTNKMMQLAHYQQQQHQQQHHHHPPQRAIMNNVYIQGTTVPKVNKSKYMMQKQSQMSQVMLPIQQQAQKSSYHQQSIVAASGSNIKYVNAQGNVIASSARVRTVMQQSSSSYQQTQSVYVENTMSPVMPQDLQSTSSVTKCSVDDMMIVNGTHMSDEMSARILQSLSKNSAYNSTTRNSNQHSNQAIKMTQQATYLKSTTTEQLAVLNPPHAIQSVQQQQLQLYSHRVSSEQAVSAVKFGPEYFRVNTCDIQSSTATFIDNIPLVSTRGDPSVTYTSHDQDEDFVGEETRPKPISSVDPHLKSLYGFLNDHNYCPAITENTEQILKKCYQKSVPGTPTNSVTQQQQQQQPKPVNSTYSYIYKPTEKDDDAHSVISNGSRAGNLDIDLGEETETAAEGEDDSITRCICDYEHDDGYMIQCDKCTSWQHVDCMGIDRQNIPDKYKCEICEPRPVDKARARALQCQKYKEQQSFLLLSAQAQQPYPVENALVHSTTGDRNPLNNNNFSSLPSSLKKPQQRQVTGSKRKTEIKEPKRKRNESTSRANGKRREPKKVSKRKASKQQLQLQQQPESGEKQAANLRSWIENYESAVTNHYSPELRARLQAIGKQQQYQSTTLPQLKNTANLDGKCTTVPHAGGKILISTLDLSPHNAVTEIRGKYMLTGQYKQQHIFPPTNAKQSSNRNPGPFIFFYRLPNDGPEICVDTRTYGNDARFVRRSCRPNAEILHTIEKGTIHLYIVSLANIKSSTEITIKHEPHDLAALSRGNISSPTSTMCACGLTKDCLFAPPLPTPPVQPIITKPRANGSLKDETDGKVTKKPVYRRSKNSSIGRGRSTSSSCESNTALLSPKNPAASPTVNMMHDSGVCTSSSSSPPLQSPLCNPPVVTTPLHSPLSELIQPTQPQQPMQPIQVQQQPQQHQQLQKPEEGIQQSQKDQINSFEPLVQLPPTPSLRQMFQQQSSVAQPPPVPAQITPVQPKINAQPALVVPPQVQVQPNPIVSPVNSPVRPTSLSIDDTPAPQTPTKASSKLQATTPSLPAIKSPPINSTKPAALGRKTPRKSFSSLSEDSSTMVDEQPKKEVTSSATKKAEDKKLTREEKKIQAIVRAFEKMEKNQQRKQDMKHKGNTPTTSTPPSSISPPQKRRRSVSPAAKRRKDDDQTPVKKSGNQVRRKKRKATKSYQQTNHHRKRLRSRINSGDSDAITSEDSTSLLSPTILGHVPPTLQSHHMKRNISPKYSEQNSSDVGSAAGMLMALSNCKVEDQGSGQSPSLSEVPKPSPSAFSLSSALMLVEAAVGPLEQTRSLENEFKMPPKTKKTIMNEWLHQSDTITHTHRENEMKPQFHHQMSYPPMLSVAQVLNDVEHQNAFTQHQLKGIYTNSSSASSTNNINKYIITEMPFQEEPQNLSIVTKRVEEFININSQDDEDEQKWSIENSNDDPLVANQPTPTPTMQKGSSVKKRWLRQAISEECSDDITTSPPNGYMTPLKKRRMARECQDMMRQIAAESSAAAARASHNYLAPSDIQPIANSSMEVEVKEERFEIIEVKEEGVKIEDDSEENTKPVFDIDEDTTTAHTSGDNSNEVQPNFENKKEQEDSSQLPSDTNFKFEAANDDASPETISETCRKSNDDQSDSKLNILTDIKVEQTQFKPSSNIDEFDIKPLNEVAETSPTLGDEKKEENSTTISDEIEDIQKRLLSFHDTNIMILQSRNKKRTPTQEDGNEFADTPRKCGKQLSFDIDVKPEIVSPVKSEPEKIAATSSSELPVSESMDWANNDLAPAVLSAATIPSFNQPILPYSAILMNGINQSMYPPQTTNEAPTTHTPKTSLSDMSTEYPDVISNLPNVPKSLLSEYLENPNKPTNNHGFAMSDTPRLLSMFNVHTPTSSRTLNNSYLTRDPSMGSTNSQLSSITNTIPVSLPPPAKVYNRSQSADPRLNPSLVTPPDPPPAPKKKLSINEYRKRKQLSSDNVNSSPTKAEPSSNNVSNAITTGADSTSEQNENTLTSPIAKKSADEKVTVFSPAPTLLELQQESLSQRLKNYKSLCSLPNAMTANRADKKDVLDSISRLELTSALSTSNSSLTSVSSSTSEHTLTTPPCTSPSNEKFDDKSINETESNASPSESTSR